MTKKVKKIRVTVDYSGQLVYEFDTNTFSVPEALERAEEFAKEEFIPKYTVEAIGEEQ